MTSVGIFLNNREVEWCHYCGNLATTVDHVVPKASGGSGRKVNLVPACYSCNQSKADTWPDMMHQHGGFMAAGQAPCPECSAAVAFFEGLRLCPDESQNLVINALE